MKIYVLYENDTWVSRVCEYLTRENSNNNWMSLLAHPVYVLVHTRWLSVLGEEW